LNFSQNRELRFPRRKEMIDFGSLKIGITDLSFESIREVLDVASEDASPEDRARYEVRRDEGVFDFLRCKDVSCGSTLSAARQRDGQWLLVLEVPVDVDGGEVFPHKGKYWEVFYQLVDGFGL